MGKHDKTRRAIFANPIRANISWRDVVSLFVHLGATVDESAEGSRVSVTLNGETDTFHAPHPGDECGKPTVRQVRDFLDRAEG